MDNREKPEILRHKLAGMISAAVELCDEGECCESCKYSHSTACTDYLIADHLIANNVTVQEWIPVTERLPDGECLAVSMLEYQPAYKEMLVGYVAKDERYETGYCCESDGAILPNVTHWAEKHYPAEGGE